MALPAGLTFVDNLNGTATLAGTPALGSDGTYNLTITAANGVTPDATQSFTLTVAAGRPPITSAGNTTFITGTAGTFTVTTTGVPTSTLSETGTLPAGVTLWIISTARPHSAGTPAAGTGEASVLTITATNGVIPEATQSFTLTVRTNRRRSPAPTVRRSTVGTFNTFTVTTSGFPTPTLSETGVLPTGVTFVDNGDGTGTLSGTPAMGTIGTYVVTFSATNIVDPDVTFTLTVVTGTATVTGLSPTSGPAAGGTLVTITGSGFTGATAVDFGTTAATNVTVVNDTTITADSPAGTGTVNVTVITPGGTSAISTADQFTYVAASPTVVSLVRFGFHMQETSLVLTFSAPLDRAGPGRK